MNKKAMVLFAIAAFTVATLAQKSGIITPDTLFLTWLICSVGLINTWWHD